MNRRRARGFPGVRAGDPDHDAPLHFENEIDPVPLRQVKLHRDPKRIAEEAIESSSGFRSVALAERASRAQVDATPSKLVHEIGFRCRLSPNAHRSQKRLLVNLDDQANAARYLLRAEADVFEESRIPEVAKGLSQLGRAGGLFPE